MRQGRNRARRRIFTAIAGALVCAGLILVVLCWNHAKADLASQSAEAVEEAVLRSAVQCYAVEGAYPSSVSYLEEHYGLLIDHSTYIVSYDAFSSNLLPEVAVLVRGDNQR